MTDERRRARPRSQDEDGRAQTSGQGGPVPSAGEEPEISKEELRSLRAELTTLRGSDAYWKDIYDAVREPLLVLDSTFRIRSANASFHEMFELEPADVDGRPIYELGDGSWDVPELRERLPQVVSADRPLDSLELEGDFVGLGRRTMLLDARRLERAGMILLAIRDVTERKHWEERQQMLVAELGHRMKNMLATIQSIASQTARSSDSLSSFNEAFSGRLQALARGHTLLTRSNWEGARLREVATEALQAHGPATDRIQIHGEEFDLRPAAALVLSMVMYELATNAAKYGALSATGGRVDMFWQLDRTELGPSLRLIWQESEGPSASPPARSGFGTSLIEHSIAYELDGEARFEFLEDGLRCEMMIPYNPANFRTG